MRSILACTALLGLLSSPAIGQVSDFTLVDNDSQVWFVASAPGLPDYEGPRLSGFISSPQTDIHLTEGWWWFRAAGQTAESHFDPGSMIVSPSSAMLSQSQLVPGLNAQLVIELVDDRLGPGSLQLKQTMTLTNTTGSAINGFNLYHYNDVDELDPETFEGFEEIDTLSNEHTLVFSARTTDTLHFHQPDVDGHLWIPFPLGIQLLTDTSAFGPNDFATNWQLGPEDLQGISAYEGLSIPAGGSISIYTGMTINGFAKVPEPSGLLMLGAAALGVALVRRKIRPA